MMTDYVRNKYAKSAPRLEVVYNQAVEKFGEFIANELLEQTLNSRGIRTRGYDGHLEYLMFKEENSITHKLRLLSLHKEPKMEFIYRKVLDNLNDKRAASCFKLANDFEYQKEPTIDKYIERVFYWMEKEIQNAKQLGEYRGWQRSRR